jgi:hypothetical protein
MAIGKSGRLVIEIDPELKELLYQSFREDGSTLKEWFIQRATHYLEEKDQQISLFEGDSQDSRKVS